MLTDLLKQKFSSGNNVPVSSVRVTREEYEAALNHREDVPPYGFVVRRDCDGEWLFRKNLNECFSFTRSGGITEVYAKPCTERALPLEFREILEEMTNDIEAELNAKYTSESRVYPSMQRAFDRDMDIVNRARALLAAI